MSQLVIENKQFAALSLLLSADNQTIFIDRRYNDEEGRWVYYAVSSDGTMSTACEIESEGGDIESLPGIVSCSDYSLTGDGNIIITGDTLKKLPDTEKYWRYVEAIDFGFKPFIHEHKVIKGEYLKIIADTASLVGCHGVSFGMREEYNEYSIVVYRWVGAWSVIKGKKLN